MPRFRIRTMLLLVAFAACILAIGQRAKRIHSAARLVEAIGGDVWGGETLYTGSGFGIEPRTRTQLLLDRAQIIGKLLCRAETELWVCFVPNERDDFGDAIELLNPSRITFDVLGKTDRTWLQDRLPELEIGAVCPSQQEDDTALSTQEVAENQITNEPLSQEEFVRAMEPVLQFFADHPKLTYRLQRYETLIGYPDHGEMGRIRDNDTGRIIYLPWPK